MVAVATSDPYAPAMEDRAALPGLWEAILPVFSTPALLGIARSEWACQIENRRAVAGPRKRACPLGVGIFIDKGRGSETPGEDDVASDLTGRRRTNGTPVQQREWLRLSLQAKDFIHAWDKGIIGAEELREACLRIVDQRPIA
jgi:hypothetical protein